MQHMLLCSLLFLCSFALQSQSEVSLKIQGGMNEDILYYTPLDSEFLFISRSEAVTNETGEVIFTLDIKKPGFLYIFPQLDYDTDDWNAIQVYVSPGSKSQLEIDNKKPGSSVTFMGDHQSANTFINSLERHFLLYINNRDKSDKFYVNNSPYESLKEIHQYQEHELSELKSLPDVNDKAFSLIASDIKQYYKEAFLILLLRHGDIENDDSWSVKEEWMEMMEATDVATISEAYGASSLWYESALKLKKIYLSQKNKILYESILSDKAEHEKQWYLLEQVFSREELRSFLGIHLYYEMWKNQFDASVLFNYTKFKENFADYGHFDVLSKPFEKQLQFEREQDLEIKIHPEKIETVEDLLSLTESDFVFMDIWATWCGPCIQEFGHISDLHNYVIDKHDKISIIYLSFDENKSKEELVKVVNYHKLNGINVLATKALKDELIKLLGRKGSISLPSYSLFKVDGQLIYKRTSRPSQWKALKKELDLALDDK